MTRDLGSLAIVLAMTCTPLAAPALAQPATVTAPAATQAGEKPPSLAEVKAKELAAAMAELAGMPVIAAKRIEDVVKLSIKDKHLALDTTVTAKDESQVQVPGLAGISKVRILTAGEMAAPGGVAQALDPASILQFTFDNWDFTTPDVVATYTSASFAVGRLTLVQMWETIDDQTYQVQLLQNIAPQPADAPADELPDPRVSLYVQVSGASPVDLRLTADNIVELRRQHPAEVAKYVDPIFRALRQEALLAKVDPRLAWQVFGDAFQPPPELSQKVDAIVRQLNAESFQQREAASQQLEQLGQPAALTLTRTPRGGLTEEQLARIDAFLAKFRIVDDAEANRLRQDRDFLLDCLTAHDEPLRARALAELRAVTGKPIEFDLAADEEQRLAAVNKLRESIGSPTSRQYKERS